MSHGQGVTHPAYDDPVGSNQSKDIILNQAVNSALTVPVVPVAAAAAACARMAACSGSVAGRLCTGSISPGGRPAVAIPYWC